MKNTKPRPDFYVLRKDFNTGEIENYNILEHFMNTILTDKNKINRKNFVIYDKEYHEVPITTKEQLSDFMYDYFRIHYSGRCECEFIVVDWPYRDYNIVATNYKGESHTTNDGLINDSRGIKVDMYRQLEPNMAIVIDLVWNYIEKLID